MMGAMGYCARMVHKVSPRVPRRIFLSEWMDERKISDERLGELLGFERETVNRWRNYPQRLSLPRIEDIAAALAIEPADLWRHPGRPSADALLRNEPAEIQAKAVEMIGILIRAGT